ncbi:MAG: AI-2E family transporter [Bacteroidales bacterium]|nr:AI-2E family transporter [Bacteroidales bacterium]
MENEKYTEKLAKYLLFAACFCIVAALCWYFRNVIIYILLAVVVSLISQPIMTLLQKVRIKGRKAPDWLLAIFTICLVILLFLMVVTLIIPVVSGIVKGISLSSIENTARQISVPLAEFNDFLKSTFPKLGNDFRIEVALLNEMKTILDVSAFSSVIGSAASMVSSIGIGVFSIVFISFFFIKDSSLFSKMVAALVPDRHEETAVKAISDIGYLLSRYFTGVLIEMTGVALINFLGLMFIARLGFNAAIGIAFLTGILNIIPYVGPLAGGALGTVLALIIKYSSSVPIGLDVSFIWFTLILIAIFSFTQLIDNILYQPVIYSTSIKSTPLEIFIVLLIAGHIGGTLGMLIAIPSYTVIRVVAFRFFRHIKAIRRLIPSEKLISENQ